ncbi:anthranilate synthase component I [Oceanobacillus piezotolerans]|uniref:Anthranilate synthase component 1 n=1 Tax=Oceanobacillus piezotolerans TaxID=2448030 RepID=A0A498DEU6_9BACI|nr:anthranilate synthase component I [Oceanobacillus piezotolerans]RLL42049.1 anthranilate synthase component I [Oceanobacillus piezotolerans]
MALQYKSIEVIAGSLTPIDIYTNLAGNKKCILESTFQHEQKGKYSFIAQNPYQEIIGHGNETVLINHVTDDKQTHATGTLQFIKEHLPKIETGLPLPFYGGAIGYVGYDVIRQFEDIGDNLPDEINMPDIHFLLYQDVIVFDHVNQKLHLIAVNATNDTENQLDQRLIHLKDALDQTPLDKPTENTSLQFEPQMTEEAFKEKVEKAKEYIRQGDIFQVVLSQRMVAKVQGSPFIFYQKLRKANPSPYMFYLDFEDYVILGASPESLVQVEGQEIITNPIAGTRPRGQTPEEDERLMQDLLADKKEIAEHRMLVDLSRNDLGKVCEIGSITIPTYMTIEKYQHVMHIVSEVKGLLNPNYSSIDALISCLPAGTVSGAPKIRAMQIINELEEKKRGAYAGGIGFINFNHNLNIALAIRSLMVKGNKAYLQAGAGIVYDSNPEMEYQETLNKARSLMEVNKFDFVSG